jgi:hypothetical protein
MLVSFLDAAEAGSLAISYHLSLLGFIKNALTSNLADKGGNFGSKGA